MWWKVKVMDPIGDLCHTEIICADNKEQAESIAHTIEEEVDGDWFELDLYSSDSTTENGEIYSWVLLLQPGIVLKGKTQEELIQKAEEALAKNPDLRLGSLWRGRQVRAYPNFKEGGTLDLGSWRAWLNPS